MKYGIGIDVSKRKSTIAVLSAAGELIVEPFEINHDIEGVKLLEEKIKDIPKEDLKIVMEETGTYHLPILGYLLDKGYFVVAENALKIKKYLDRGLRKVKTDKKDSLKLAEYCCDNWYKLSKVRENDEIYTNLRFLSRRYLDNVAIQTKEKISFSNLCDLLFPGYYQLLDENNFILGLEVFKKYYHPDIVTAKKQSQFIIEIDELARELPEYEEINKMPGVGKKLTSRIIAEIGDVRRFKNAGSIIAYAGLDAPPYQSGKFEATNRHISKRGNKHLRKTGYEVMKSIKSSCKSDNELKEYIIKKENEGKSKKSAKIAGLNKFLRMYYGIVKRIYKEQGKW